MFSELTCPALSTPETGSNATLIYGGVRYGPCYGRSNVREYEDTATCTEMPVRLTDTVILGTLMVTEISFMPTHTGPLKMKVSFSENLTLSNFEVCYLVCQ